MYISVSPNPYEDNSNDDAFSQIFSPKIIPMEAIEDLNNDNLYFYKEVKKISSGKTASFEDFDQFYKKLTDVKGINELEAGNYEKPSFSNNLSQENIFCSFENENYVNVMNNSDNVTEETFKKKCKKIELNETKETGDIKDKKSIIIDINQDNIDNEINIIDMEKIIEKECKSEKEEKENNNMDEFNISENKNIANDIIDFNNNFNIITCSIDKDTITKKKTQEEIFFPFSPGKGIIQCFKVCDDSCSSYNQIVNISALLSQDLGNSQKFENSGIPPNNPKTNSQNSQNYTEKITTENFNEEENSIYSEQIEKGNENLLFRFTTKKYFITENGKRKRIKKKRKFKSDDMRKKIKSRFHKTFKNIINENLKKAGSKKLFDFLPQCFIGNVSKKTNNYCLNLTYKEILLTDFISEYSDNYPNKNVDYKKYQKNKEVLEYLEKNPEICKKSGFDIIQGKKYKELLNIYFNSAEFEDSIMRLKKENESEEYIQEYVLKAKNFVKYYSNYEKDENKDEISEEDK